MLAKLDCGSHFTTYTYIKSLRCALSTYTVFYVNYISIKLEGEKKQGNPHLKRAKLGLPWWRSG